MRISLLAAALACNAGPLAAHADEAALQTEVAALRAEVDALKTQMHQLQGVYERSAPVPAAQVPPASVAVAGPAAGVAAPVSAPTAASETTLWGYGQIDYRRPTADASAAQADLTRAVIGFSHAFDDTTHVYGEIEWEHAIASADDAGEVEVEQLYVEHMLGAGYGVRAGLQLVPLGLLNEHHEPTNFYGVERNFVETAIIPSTWREGAVALYGSSDSGLAWNVGIGTGPDLGAWDATSDDGRASPLGSIHQELQLAKARDPSLFAALNWQGIPGLLAGGGVFTGEIAQGAANFPAADARLVLGEAHVRWQPGAFDFAALYARGSISDTQALNLTFLGQPTPVPKSFWGGYVQAAWRALAWDQSSLVPFARYEAFNTAAAYAAQPQGLGASALPAERVWTAGVNYYLNPNVVFKVDYQRFNNDDVALGYGNRLDLGIGYQF
jgi:hypothetical protein